MITYKYYNLPMVNVTSFSKDKHEKFCMCPDCRKETSRNKLEDDELVFGEILKEEFLKKYKR